MVSKERANEGNSLTLFVATVLGVNPEPSANTTSFRTGWHPRRDRKVRIPIPNTRVVHTEDGEVFRFDFGDVRLVCDR
jgi:hypothetical protein